MQEYTIHPLVVGANETDQGIMTYLRDYGQRIWIPIYVFYVKGGDKNILVDTGLEQFVVPDDLGETYGFDVLEFEEALATVGLRPEEIDVIIHTHLHNDHCENDYKCPRAKVYVQKAEMDFFRNPHPIDHRYYPDVLDGVDVDSGTAWEIGYAHALDKPVYGLRTDFRTLGIEGTVNLMIERSVVLCTSLGELVKRLELER